MDQEGGGWVRFQEVVDVRDDCHDRGWWGEERTAGEAFDEGCDQGCGETGRGEEGVEEAEEAGAMLALEEVGIDEGVQLGVEGWIIQVLGCDEME